MKTIMGHELRDGDIICDPAYPEGRLKISDVKKDGCIVNAFGMFIDGGHIGYGRSICMGSMARIRIEDSNEK